MEKYHCKEAYQIESTVPTEEKAMDMADFLKFLEIPHASKYYLYY